ncbi:hypothetical protein GCM10009814_23830 [Lapillicoccus jejuensis]
MLIVLLVVRGVVLWPPAGAPAGAGAAERVGRPRVWPSCRVVERVVVIVLISRESRPVGVMVAGLHP